MCPASHPGACWNPTQTEQHQGWQLQRRPWLNAQQCGDYKEKKLVLLVWASVAVSVYKHAHESASEAVGCSLWVSRAHLNMWGIRRQTGVVSTWQWTANYCEWHTGGGRFTPLWHSARQNRGAAALGRFRLSTGQSHKAGCAPAHWGGGASPRSWAPLCPWPVLWDVTGHCF